MDWFTFLVAALAVYRISTLIVQDSITAELREWWWKRFPVSDFVYTNSTIIEVKQPNGTIVPYAKAWPFKREVVEDDDWGWVPTNVYKLGELIECIFCVSIWVAAATAAVLVGYTELPAVFEYLLYLFGTAGAVEIINLKLGR
jgi:hypothetical protein